MNLYLKNLSIKILENISLALIEKINELDRSHITWNEEIFTFGKYKGQKVKDVFTKDVGYFGWIQNADFPLYTKKVLTKIQLRSKF